MKNKKHARPFFLTYYILKLPAILFLKLRFKLHVKGKRVKGPALILSNHTSNYDFLFISKTTFQRITFLATSHWFTFRGLKTLLNIMGVIPKYQFAADITAYKKMQEVLKKRKGIVYIAPEGAIFSGGSLGYISPSIAKLIKHFNVPVYASLIEGAGLGSAKWSAAQHKNHIDITTNLIITAQETKTLDTEEIMKRILESLYYKDSDFLKKHDINVTNHDKAENLDNLLYKCPHCGKEFTLKSHGNSITCSACGAEAIIQNNYSLKWNCDISGFEFIENWYDMQLSALKKEISDPGFSMSEEVEYGTCVPGKNKYTKVGRGTIKLDSTGWTYNGTFKDKTVTEHDNPREVIIAPLKMGKYFELPYKYEKSRVFYPVANPKTAVKWHLASRAITEMNETENAEK